MTASSTLPAGCLGKVLGFLQAQGGQLADDVDDIDLLRAGILEDDGELGLLLFGRRRGTGRRSADAIATATGAAAVTPHFSSSIFESSAASIT